MDGAPPVPPPSPPPPSHANMSLCEATTIMQEKSQDDRHTENQMNNQTKRTVGQKEGKVTMVYNDEYVEVVMTATGFTGHRTLSDLQGAYK